MKIIGILLSVAAVAMAQYRPSYFPRPGGFSTVLTTNSEGSQVNLGDRNSAFQPDAPGSENYLVDTQLNNRVQTWPKEKLPFWYINREHIEQHRNQGVPCTGEGCAQATANRGSFAGPDQAPRPSFFGANSQRP